MAVAQVNAMTSVADRLSSAARQPLDFRPDEPLNDAGQVIVQPGLQHGAQHLTDHPVGELGASGRQLGRQRRE